MSEIRCDMCHYGMSNGKVANNCYHIDAPLWELGAHAMADFISSVKLGTAPNWCPLRQKEERDE